MMTPEHFQLLSTRHLEAAAHPDEHMSDTEEVATGGMARMARFELRRRQCQVPVRNRYDSVALRTAARKCGVTV